MEISITKKSIYYQGKMVDCNILTIESTRDDFSASADIYYGIGNADNKGVAQGTLTINGDDYTKWNAQPDANVWIANWVLKQLNIK